LTAKELVVVVGQTDYVVDLVLDCFFSRGNNTAQSEKFPGIESMNNKKPDSKKSDGKEIKKMRKYICPVGYVLSRNSWK